MVLLLAIPSLGSIFKYVPYPALASVFYVICCIVYFIFLSRTVSNFSGLNRVLNWRPLSYCLITVNAIVAYFLYPIADGRKQIGKGSAADDAIIEPALTLLRNESLYSPALYGGVPISPGPGWILQNASFALLDIFWLMSAFYMALSVFVVRACGASFRATNIALLLLWSSLIFWRLLITGHDIIAIGFSALLLTALAYKVTSDKATPGYLLVFVAALAGLFATSRIVFLFYPILLALLMWRFDRQKSLVFVMVSMLVALLLHGYFYITSDIYQPLHLIDRGENRVGLGIMGAGLAATLVAFTVVYRALENTLENWVSAVFVCMSIPLAAISIGEFWSSHMELAFWEGANYLFLPAPMLLFLVACSISKSRRSELL